MLPEAGATELLFLAAVALIVVGPKDLPVLMRKVGQWVAKMRGLAQEFRSSFDELARQSELDELRKEVEALRNERIPDPLASLQPALQEVQSGLEAPSYSIGDPHAASYGLEAPMEPAPEAEAPKPVRKPRARKSPAAEDGADAATPEAKPRRRRAKAAGEAEA